MNAMQRGDERQPLSGKRYDACVNLSHGREIGRAFAESLNSHSPLYPNYNRPDERGKQKGGRGRKLLDGAGTSG